MGDDEILEDGIPEFVFVGRSNVGKSSVINTLIGRRDLARSSATAGKTTELNFYLVNKQLYLVDLPGYGYAKASHEERDNLRKLIYWYLLYSDVSHKKIFLIIDANVGVTSYDAEMLRRLIEREKNIVIVANKVDKIKKSLFIQQMNSIQEAVGTIKVIPYSATEKQGVSQLRAELTI